MRWLIYGSWAAAIPRLTQRKLPSQTFGCLAELGQLVSLAAKSATVAESRSLVRGASLLVQQLGVCVQEGAGNGRSELTASYVSEPAHLASQELVRLGYGRPF